ncbi:MAG: indole-3-glycerol phosphate synthase TrpC [Balneolaceae bacterium]
MASILTRIIEQTEDDLRKQKQKVSFSDLHSFELYEKPRLDFARALRRVKEYGKGSEISVIAEIKKASPSKGVIRAPFDPLEIAEEYVKGGASAISVLTDKPFFQGDLEYLKIISNEFDIPLLRKDFIIDPYQIKEARAWGADAVLLIATVTSGSQLNELLDAANELGLQALVECYSDKDVEKLDWDKVKILGVNNRDLNTFEVDLHRGIKLLNESPGQTVRVSESGLASAEDLMILWKHGIDAALIGEYFMRQPSPGLALRQMLDRLNQLVNEMNRQEST